MKSKIVISTLMSLALVASSYAATEGWYRISPKARTAGSWDLPGVNGTTGSLSLYASDNGTDQKWFLKDVGNWKYEFIPRSNMNKRLDVPGANDFNGNQLQVWDVNNSEAQRFFLWDFGDGFWEIKSAIGTQRALDLDAGNPANDTKIHLWDKYANDNQKWQFNNISVASVYQDCNYGGKRVELVPGNYTMTDLGQIGIGNDWISSLKVNAGYRIVAYWDDNFTGATYTWTGDDDCTVGEGWNDKITSLKVEVGGGNPVQTGPYSINGYDIMQSGYKKVLKGYNWDPTAPCEAYANYNYGYAAQDAQAMKEANVNCIRLYNPTTGNPASPGGWITTAQLNEFSNRNIDVIMTVHSGWNDNLHEEAVSRFGNHPAVKMWGVGNEIDWNWFYTRQDAASGTPWAGFEWMTRQDVVNHANAICTAIRNKETALGMAHKPIVVSWGNTTHMNGYVNQLNADVVSYQIYNNLSLDDYATKHRAISTKPYFMSEFGSDAWDARYNREGQSDQAYGVGVLLDLIRSDVQTKAASGGIIFSWSDGWWKAGDPYGAQNCTHETGGVAPGVGPYPDLTFNEEYWGHVDINRNKRSAYYTLKDKFGLVW